MSKISEILAFYASSEASAKMAVAVSSSIFLFIFILVFVCLFYKFYYKKNVEARRLFWIFMIVFGLIVIIKFLIGVLYKGYIPELMFFYAIPSPKITGYLWFLLATVTFLFFLRFRTKIETFSTQKFLLSLFLFFFVFSISVAAIREGLASVAEPYTRTYWEYTGNISFVHNVKDFLHDYIIFELQSPLAHHSVTHPPGYTLILYFFHKLFSAGFLGMALLTVFSAGLVLWPLYYIWKNYIPELEIRRALEMFIFIPSAVMMTATSTEAFFMLVVWVSIAACLSGWKRNWLLAILGGLTAAISLFCNFLFLLLAPFFVFLCWQSLRGSTSPERAKILFRILLSLVSFALFFVFIWKWSGYSIIDNFFTANVANQGDVGSNFASAPIYLLYLLMNMASFLIYLGLPLVYMFFSNLPSAFKSSSLFFKSGVAVLIFFLAVGVFQGNVERLWLFILPFFPIFANKLFKEEYKFLFDPFLVLVFFQIIVTQIVFYTFY